MKREDLQLGQAVFLAELVFDGEAKERLVVHQLEVKLLGKRFYELANERRRIRNTWEARMSTIRLLGTTAREAVVNLERSIEERLEAERSMMRRKEEDALEHRKLFTDWYKKTP